MDRIRDDDITATVCPTGGVTLSWESESGKLFRRWYSNCSLRGATQKFKAYLREEDAKIRYGLTREDVLVNALQGICGGDRDAARRLLGDS
jgi:hypothetical protein